jgi:hypothetical protein
MSLFRDFNDEYTKYFVNDFPTRATVAIELISDELVKISATCKT